VFLITGLEVIFMENIPRCLLIFENSCKSKSTFRDYKTYLDWFLNWCHKDYESLLMMGQVEIEDLLQDYCIYQKRRAESGEINPNSISTFFHGIFKFLKVNKKKIDRESITVLYPPRKKLSGEKAVTTEQIQIMLDSTGEKREKALIHVFSATGARVEAISELQLKHVEPYKDGYLKLILYADDQHEMVTFLHPEATEVLNSYFEERRKNGEKLTKESFVFVVSSNRGLGARRLSKVSIEALMRRLWIYSGIERRKNGKRYDLATTTAFRKRFDTILEFHKDVPMGATQYLMDHTGYMSGTHYRRPTVEQVFEACKVATPQLMVSEKYRMHYEIEKKEQEIKQKNELKDKRIEDLEKRLENTQKLLQSVLERLEIKN